MTKAKLIFLHIPKTAGTSLRVVSDAHYTPERVLTVYGEHIPEAQAYIRRQNLNKFDFIRGHIGYGPHRVIDGPVEYMTILRHPLDRLISLYLHIRKSGVHFAHKEVMRMDFPTFVFSGVLAETDNGQVRQLAGLEEFQQVPYPKGIRPYGADELELALKNLETFSLVGTQERFSDVLAACNRIWGWTIPKQEPRYNLTKPSPVKASLSYDDIKAVLDYNVYDLFLWKYACERMEALDA